MASIATKFGLGSSGGQFYGAQAPKKAAGKLFMPPHCWPSPQSIAVNTTAARYYVVPFIVEQTTTFAGAWCYNSGTGDNGDLIKIATFSEATAGGPGTLAKDFGAVTLTGVSAIRQLASSWTANSGVYYLELVSNNAVDLFPMTTFRSATAAGSFIPQIAANTMGFYVSSYATSATNLAPTPNGDYVGGTYANFPEATSLTPTATFIAADSLPIIGLYT